MINRLKLPLILLCLFANGVLSHAQVVGSHDNSDIIPKEAKASSLKTGIVSGDVNLFTGDYQSSMNLGSVSTPGGLSFSLSLSYSSTYTEGTSPTVASGIPYGEGWSLGIPSISVSTAAYFSFLETYECIVSSPGLSNPDTNYYSYNDAVKNGDSYWYSPTINIPGYANGKAIFKYFEDNGQTAVFILNKFEKYVELRFDGSSWRVQLDNGDVYLFEAALMTYRSPNNKRVLDYDYMSVTGSEVGSIIAQDDYSALQAAKVKNVIEPKGEFTTWYGTEIYNKNIQHQVIRLEYEKFGEFNFFQEYNQNYLDGQIGEKILKLTIPGGGFNEDFNVYKDLLLKKVVAYNLTSECDILELNYETAKDFGANMLDINDPLVGRKDSLYSYQSVFSEGGSNGAFNSEWSRYLHGKSSSSVLSPANHSIGPSNPYLINNTKYWREEDQGGSNTLPFNHGFLESKRIEASKLVSGDTYEIRTKVIDNNGSSASQGNGTIDIAVVTGDCDLNISSSGISSSTSFNSLNSNSGSYYLKTSYNKTRDEQVYSTFGNPIKWHLNTNSTNVETSNFFVMPNLPSTNKGAHIQIGPGNSDTKYDKPPTAANDNSIGLTTAPATTTHPLPTSYNAYAHRTPQFLQSYNRISSNFGIGMPWSMVLPLYTDAMGGLQIDSISTQNIPRVQVDTVWIVYDGDTIYKNSNPFYQTTDTVNFVKDGFSFTAGLDVYHWTQNKTNVHSNPKKSDFAQFWWNDTDSQTVPDWTNKPTKFNNSVQLKEMELIRYSKNPYMLKSVKNYKINGELSHLSDSAYQLTQEYAFDYERKDQSLYENFDYMNQSDLDSIGDIDGDGKIYWTNVRPKPINLGAPNLVQNLYLLASIKEVPVGHFEDSVLLHTGTEDTVRTDFEYDWFSGTITADWFKTTTNEIDIINSLPAPYIKVVVDTVWFNPGRKGILLNKIIDPLGGETEITYYPRDSKATLVNGAGNNKGLSHCGVNFRKNSYASARAKVVHPSVKSIVRNQALAVPTEISVNNLLNTKTDYYYDTTKIIWETEDIHLPEKFRYAYQYDYQKGFENVTTVNSELNSGERNYSVSYFGGNIYTTNYDAESSTVNYDTTNIDEYMFFGKLLKVENFNHQNVLESSTEMTYDFTLAHKNALERSELYRNNIINPHSDFERFSGVSAAYHDYEYGDYYGDDMPFLSAINSSLFSYVRSGSALSKDRGTHEGSKCLTPHFYSSISDLNSDWRLSSYFVKLKSKSTKEYDQSCVIDKSTILQDYYSDVNIADNPFGGEPTNPKPYTPVFDYDLIQLISEAPNGGLGIVDTLIGVSPLSDTVIDHILKSSEILSDEVIFDILNHQNPLKNDFLISIYNSEQNLRPNQIISLFNNQPHITDLVQKHVIAKYEFSQNEIITAILNKNDYLSNKVLETLFNQEGFPEIVINDVLVHQPQLNLSTLSELLENSSEVEAFNMTNILKSQDYLSDDLYGAVLDNENLSNSDKASILVESGSYPSTNEIINDYLELNLTRPEVLAIGTASPRVFPSSTKEKFEGLLSAVEYQTFELSQSALNAYERYCANPVICSNGFIESIEDYTYFEANYDGSTLAEGYKKLLGLEDVVGKPVDGSNLGLPSNITLQSIQLKHEPSWQLHSVNKYSPQYDSAFSKQEYYYYYDELNRHDRHLEYYDLANDVVSIATEETLIYDTIVTLENSIFGDFYLDPSILYGQVPLSDGGRCSQRNSLRNIPFQETTISKNNIDENPLSKSFYYKYEAKWVANEYYNSTTHAYSGSGCDSVAQAAICSEDFNIIADHSHGYTDSEILALLPLGQCAYTIGYPFGPLIFINAGYTLEDCPELNNILGERRLVGCNDGSTGNGGGTEYVYLYADYEAQTMHLQNVIAQIDTVKNSSPDWSERLDASNSYIAFFKIGAKDTNGVFEDDMIFPFDTLAIRTIDELNQYGQIALEHNQSDIYTKYNYDLPTRIWNVNTNNNSLCAGLGNYSSLSSTNIGLPTSIVVGYGRDDSLRTDYEYYPNYQLKSITDPNQKVISYQYDDYGRLYEGYENNKLLVRNLYSYWDRNSTDDYLARTNKNYVESYAFTDTISNPSSYNGLHSKKFIDVFGREVQSQTAINNDQTIVISPTAVYDNWGRVTKTLKPIQSTATTLNLAFSNTGAYQENLFEKNTKGRLLRSAAFGINQIFGAHTVKQSYSIVNDLLMTCDLGLAAEEVEWLIGESLDDNQKFYKSVVEDEDGKALTTYTNPLGQKVATLQNSGGADGDILTLFGYDSYGNLNKVVNPEKQTSTYNYNILGQLYLQNTPDAGNTKYMYNKQGNLALKQTENGKIGKAFDGTVETYFTKYTYDDYGRLLNQKLASKDGIEGYGQTAYTYPLLGLLNYADTISGVDGIGTPILNNSSVQDYFEYKFSNNSTYYWKSNVKLYMPATSHAGSPYIASISVHNLIEDQEHEKSFEFGENSQTYDLGKLNRTIDYNIDGEIVNVVDYAYSIDGNLLTEETEFNPSGKGSLSGVYTDTSKTVKSKIIYSGYNYQKALLQKDVDINNDGSIDFQYHNKYDDWGNLSEVYFNFYGDSSNKVLIAEYSYDLLTGQNIKTEHKYTTSCSGSIAEYPAQTIVKTYDIRNRLTEQTSELLQVNLFYDDQTLNQVLNQGVNSSNNWNGNINGMEVNYKNTNSSNYTNITSGNIELGWKNSFEYNTIYGFEYDGINRLIVADAVVGDKVANSTSSLAYGIGDVFYTFDKIGNFKSLQRAVELQGPSTNPHIKYNDWAYNYEANTNKLLSVSASSSTSTARQYSYDTNGNLLSDDFRELDTVIYYRDNFPKQINKPQETIHYLYGTDDIRMYKKVEDLANQDFNKEEYYLKDIGIYDMVNEEWTYYVSGLSREAKIKPTGSQEPAAITANQSNYSISDAKLLDIDFYISDYLGNTRVVYKPSVDCRVGGPVFETDNVYMADYFPYGKILREFVQGGEREKFLTTQHERDDETGLDYRGARFYDSDVGRFLSLDPLAANYPSLSDYSYVAGNPIYFIDPTGMAVEDWVKNNSNGEIVWDANINSQEDFINSCYNQDEYSYLGSEYSLPSGNGTFTVPEWTTFGDIEDPSDPYWMTGPSMSLQYNPSSTEIGSNYLQTYSSNYPRPSSADVNENDILPNPIEMVDDSFSTDPVNGSTFYNYGGTNTSAEGRILSDQPQRGAAQTTNQVVTFHAQTTLVTNTGTGYNREVSVSWGMTVHPSGKVDYHPITIIPATTQFHNTAFENLPK